MAKSRIRADISYYFNHSSYHFNLSQLLLQVSSLQEYMKIHHAQTRLYNPKDSRILPLSCLSDSQVQHSSHLNGSLGGLIEGISAGTRYVI